MARVLGGAGTGKTVVAMHRAKALSSQCEGKQKISLTTFTANLAADIQENLRKICTVEELRRIEVIHLDAWVNRFMPVLIIGTYDENGVPNAMNAAWGCITDMNEVSISMAEHKTTENIAKTGSFTVSMATEDTVVPCDYVGIESANKVPDKFARAGFHATKSEYVNAPLIDDLPMALECKLKSFENSILIGEIVNVTADESILTNGKIDPKKLKPITYDPVNNTYVGLGETVGKAFGDGLKLKI